VASLGGLQPADSISVPVTPSSVCSVLVVIPPNRVAGFAFQSFLDNQPRRELDQFVLRRSCGYPKKSNRVFINNQVKIPCSSPEGLEPTSHQSPMSLEACWPSVSTLLL
jgi:hypothetical protein